MPIGFIQIPYGHMYQTIIFMSWMIQQCGKIVNLFYRTEYRNVSETELCNVENLISTFLKKEKCKVVTKRDRILDNYFKQCIGFKCKQTRYVFVNLYAFEVRQKFKPTDDGYYILAVLAQNPYNTIINAFPPKTHNIYNLVLMVNLTAQTVEWYNPQKNRL